MEGALYFANDSVQAGDGQGGDDRRFDPQDARPEMGQCEPRRTQRSTVSRPETALRPKCECLVASCFDPSVTS